MSNMTTEVAVPQTFEQRMKTRIKDSIGDLITDEDLTKMVTRSVEEVFFAKRQVKDGSYSTREIPSLMHEIVKECLEPQVRVAASLYINSHQEEVQVAITSAIEGGMGRAIVNAITNRFQNDLLTLQSNIINNIQKG